MSARFTFPEAREWRYIISSLATLITEANFVVDNEGLRLRALDPSRAAMVDLFVPSDAFDEYEVSEEKVSIGVSFDDLEKVMRRSKSDDRVTFEVKEGRLKVILIGKADRTFSLPLIDIVGEELPTPKVTFNVMAKMMSDTFKDALSDAELVSETVKLIGEEEVLKVLARSDRGEVEVKFSLEAGSLLEYEVKEPSTSTYSIDYLLKVLRKAAKVSDIATLEFSTNMPLSLTFELTGGGQLRFFLAPRVEG